MDGAVVPEVAVDSHQGEGSRVGVRDHDVPVNALDGRLARDPVDPYVAVGHVDGGRPGVRQLHVSVQRRDVDPRGSVDLHVSVGRARPHLPPDEAIDGDVALSPDHGQVDVLGKPHGDVTIAAALSWGDADLSASGDDVDPALFAVHEDPGLAAADPGHLHIALAEQDRDAGALGDDERRVARGLGEREPEEQECGRHQSLAASCTAWARNSDLRCSVLFTCSCR